MTILTDEMKESFKALRLQQVSHSLMAFNRARYAVRPKRGWLKAVREALGVSHKAVGEKLRLQKQNAQYFETAEAKGTITLKNLQRAADALDCKLVYAIVPKSGSLLDLAKQHNRKKQRIKEHKIRNQVRRDVLRVENTMALENQAAGDVELLIEQETQRRLKK